MGFTPKRPGVSADNIRVLRGGNVDEPTRVPGDANLKRPLAQSPNTAKQDADELLPLAVVRELANGTPADRARLRAIVAELSPRGQANLMTSIVTGTRDPRSPAKAITLTPEGQMMVDVAFNGIEPDAAYLKEKGLAPRAEIGPKSPDAQGPDGELTMEDLEFDSSEKAAPDRPEGANPRQIYDRPAFRSDEKVVQGKDGEFKVKHENTHLDRPTQRAIDRAKEGKPVAPIYDDPKNTPPNVPTGTALASGTRSPKQQQTQRLQRLMELRDPHGNALGDSLSVEAMKDLPVTGGDNQSVFAPRGGGGVQGRSVTTVRPQDYQDVMESFKAIRRGKNTHPGQQYSSAEEFARDLVASGNQEMFNVTPVTARQRGAVTGYVDNYAHDPELAIDRAVDPVGPASVGRMAREEFPEAVSATKTAERAVMQEQAIESLTRKLENIFGHQGWGENFKPSYRPAGTDVASVETGPRPGTTQDPAQVPGLDGSANARGEQPQLPTRVAPGKPGFDVDPEMTTDDLVEWHQMQQLDGEGAPIKGGDAESVVTTGRAQGDKSRTKPAKPREEGGHKTGAYEDETSFAEYNKRHREGMPESDIARRQKFYEQWKKAVEMEPARSSELRREMDALLEEPDSPEKASRVAELQRKLLLSERLDAMSGIKSFESQDTNTGLILRPGEAPDAQLAKPRPIQAETFDLDGKPHQPEVIDAEFELKRPMDEPSRSPDEPSRLPDKSTEPETKTQTQPFWKKAAKAGAVVGGGLLGYEMLRRMGQPPYEPPFPPTGNDFPGGPGQPPGGGGPEGFPLPPAFRPGGESADPDEMMTPADRIRALRSSLRLNPNTQTLQNWTN